MPWPQLPYLLDPGRNRLGDHLEVSELHPARREFDRRVLLGGLDQSLSAGRHRHQDDSYRCQHAQHHHLQGHLRRPWPECLSRTGEDSADRRRRAELHSVRFAVDGGSVWRAHLSLSRGAQPHRHRRARSEYLAHQRGAVVLLPAARGRPGGRGKHDCERILSLHIQGVTDGICSRSSESAGGQFGGFGRMKAEDANTSGTALAPAAAASAPLLEIRDLHARVGGQNVLQGVSLTVNAGEMHAIMGPNGSGKSTLAYVLSGRPGYEITAGTVSYDGEDLLALAPEERARSGVFLGFQYPVEIPGVNNVYLLKAALNAQRKAAGEPEVDAYEFLALIRQKMKLMHMSESFLSRGVNEGFSGGEKKRNEVLQMLVLEPKLAILDETDSGLDIDALKVVSAGVNSLRDPARAVVLVTHYQRLLDYVIPDQVHVLSGGRIVKSGDKSLAQELERRGYDWVMGAEVA